MAAGSVGAFAGAAWLGGLVATSHAFDATCWIIIVWLGLHFGLGIVMLGYCLAGSFAGKMTGLLVDRCTVAMHAHQDGLAQRLPHGEWIRD